MYCPNCEKEVTTSAEGYGAGPEITDYAIYCDECGEELDSISAAEYDYDIACDETDRRMYE